MLQLIRASDAPAPRRRPARTVASSSARIADAASDWTLRQFASEGALATPRGARPSLALLVTRGAK